MQGYCESAYGRAAWLLVPRGMPGYAPGQSQLQRGESTTKVLFICPHGAGKSVLASVYFEQFARAHGLQVRVDALGTEPDPAVAPK